MEIQEPDQNLLIPDAAPAEDEKKDRSNFRRFVIDLLETIILSVLLFLAIDVVSARICVDGISMKPTLKNGEFVLINKMAYKFGQPRLGDVIVFHFPRDRNK